MDGARAAPAHDELRDLVTRLFEAITESSQLLHRPITDNMLETALNLSHSARFTFLAPLWFSPGQDLLFYKVPYPGQEMLSSSLYRLDNRSVTLTFSAPWIVRSASPEHLFCLSVTFRFRERVRAAQAAEEERRKQLSSALPDTKPAAVAVADEVALKLDEGDVPVASDDDVAGMNLDDGVGLDWMALGDDYEDFESSEDDSESDVDDDDDGRGGGGRDGRDVEGAESDMQR